MLGRKFSTSKRLLSVTFLMLVLPIFSYFFSRRIFKASAAVSVIMIHGVLVGVIILAYKEDQLQGLDDKED